MELFCVTTCRAGNRVLMSGTIVEVPDDEGERLLALDFCRHPRADDAAPAPPPESEPVDPVTLAQSERDDLRASSSFEWRTHYSEQEIDRLYRLVAELSARLAAIEAR